MSSAALVAAAMAGAPALATLSLVFPVRRLLQGTSPHVVRSVETVNIQRIGKSNVWTTT